MTSTELNVGCPSGSRPSSRVLKPPGGGHSNIFAEPEVRVNAPRPKYNQQNSSNLNACIGSTDPNVAVEKLREEISSQVVTKAARNGNENNNVDTGNNNNSNSNNGNNNNQKQTTTTTSRVPPGGHSSGGFW